MIKTVFLYHVLSFNVVHYVKYVSPLCNYDGHILVRIHIYTQPSYKRKIHYI